MKKLFTLFFLALLPITASAQVVIDGINYFLHSGETNTAEVTVKSSGYSGVVVIPASVMHNNKTYRVTSIGRLAFKACSGLTSVTIPNSVNFIGERAFEACSGLTSVHISDIAVWCNIEFDTAYSNPLEYAHHLYLNGNEILNLVIPNRVTSISSQAFRGCSGLTSVTIPNSVTSIGGYAFYDCNGLTSVTIPNSVTSISGHTFSGCSGLTSVTIPNSVTSIGSHAFFYCRGLTSMTIPNSVTSIGESAFGSCDGLTSVTIPNSVISIGDMAFDYCSGLTSVTIPNNVTSIGEKVFRYCSGLTSVTIGKSVTSIGESAFDSCSGLTSLTIPNSVTSIGKYAFQGCSGLTSVTIPNSVTSIGYWAFNSCKGLTSVHISDIAAWCKISFNTPNSNPLEYAHHLYLNGEEITDLVIPNSVTSIGDYAFYDCDGLTSVTIPNSVTSIGERAFCDCDRLTFVTIGNSVTSIGKSTFSSCSSLTSLTLGNSVTSIGKTAFYGCESLTSVTIPNSVTSINFGAFEYCIGLTSVIIPNSVTSIDGYAFGYCYSLTDFYCYAENVPETGANAFYNTNIANVTLHVPAGSVEDYSSTEPWSGFGTIVAIGDNPIAYVEYYDGTLTFYYDRLRKSRQGTIYDVSEIDYVHINGWEEKSEEVTKAVFDASFAKYRPKTTYRWFNMCSALEEIQGIEYLNTSEVTSMGSMFEGCTNLTSLDVSGFKTDNVTFMGSMFSGCSGLTSLDVSGFKTDNVTSMGSMFSGCSGLTSLDVSGFKTDNVTSMMSMFSRCSSLTSLDVSGFKTDNVTLMAYMFQYCSSLTSLDVSGFKTDNVTYIISMFDLCSGLTSLDVSGFKTDNVTNLDWMFYGCSSLTSLDISGFKTNNVTHMGSMFNGCSRLTTIYVSDGWSTEKVIDGSSTYMFDGCTNLVGGNGTKYDANHTDVKYARVDKTGAPGYFTLSGDDIANLKDGDVFVHKTCEGVDMTFKIISAADKTIQVGTGEENASAINKDYEGTVTIPDEINGFTVDEIAYDAFVDCKFSSIVFPSTLTAINGEALLRCMSLKSIFIPRSVKYIAPAAFASCTAVESIVVEEGNQAYDSREGCNAIIISLDNVLHRGCKTTVIPSDIERINFAAFQWTPFEGKLTIPEGVTYIGQAAFYHTTMTSVTLPSTLTYIGGWSFQDCDGLESVGIPNGVTYIGNYAFSDCDKLSRVTIPASVTEIGENAFNGNEQLKVVVSYITEPRAIADDVFMNNGDFTNATLYVPNGTKTIYENTDGWSNFENIVEMNATAGDVTGDGIVTKEDIVEIETEILEPSEDCNPNKDVNHDGVVNVADIVTIINITTDPNAGSDPNPNPNPTPSVEGNPIISIGVNITNNSSSAVTLDGYLRLLLGNPDHNGYYFGGWQGTWLRTGDIRFSDSSVTLAPGETKTFTNLSWKDEDTGCGLGETSPLSPSYLPIKEDGNIAYARNVLIYTGGRSDLILCDNLNENIIFQEGGVYSIVIR